jgi:hypothetical protein
MSDKEKKQRSEEDAALEREIREGRKFDLAEAIGRMAGPGGLKGVSPVPRKQQAMVEIDNWLSEHMPAGNGELKMILLRSIEGSEIFLNNFEQPIVALTAFCRQVLDSDYLVKELVREADVEWGRLLGERPFFEREGAQPHRNDPYTVESVRNILTGLVKQLTVEHG